MNNDSIVGQATVQSAKSKSSKKRNHPFWLAILGFMSLSGAISSLQHLSKAFANDVYKISFIGNWIPWVAALFFALGWFITHWLEGVVSKNQFGMARVLFVIILFGGLSISWYFRYFLSNEVLQRFDPMLLIYSGYFLRFSTFRAENTFRFQKALFGKLIDQS